MNIKKRGEIYLISVFALLLLLSSCSLNEITGFAVSEENTAANETLNESSTISELTINETAAEIPEKKEKIEKEEKPKEEKKEKGPNIPPVWKSDISEFTIYGKTAFDLNNYFYDENNDTITYTSTIPEKIEVAIDGNTAILTPLENNFTTTIEFTASDGDKQTTKEVTLIVPERSISINLQYKPSSYDSDENGYEPVEGIIDFTVENSKFSWDANESNLCTKWDVYSVQDAKSTTVCYGSEKCCAFIGLAPSRDIWKEPFYSTYSQYGATLNNILSAQVIYVDYGLKKTKPYAEIYYSQWQNLSANYYFSSVDFRNVCVDTCILEGFNESEYKIIIEIDNAILNIDAFTYSIAEQISNVLMNLIIKDDKGIISGIYSLYKENVLVPIVENFVAPDYYDIEIVPADDIMGVIDKIIIEKANITKPFSGSIGIDNVTKEISIENVDVKKKYAVDLEDLEFEKATLTANATANALYKCRLWDYERELCLGTWEKVKDLAVGEAYNITLTADDPGFIEGNVNITITQINITNISELALIKDIPNITIIANNNATIDLSEHFSNIDESTVFTYFEQQGIIILFDGSIAAIVPDADFAGTAFTYVTAAKGADSAISNLFSINVVNITAVSDITPNLILKKKDFMSDEDVDLDFEYLTKQELIKENEWKEEFEVYEEKTEKTEDELNLFREKIKEEEKLLSEAEKSIKKQKKKWQKANDTIEAFVYDNGGNLKDINVEIEELREGKFDIKLPKQRAFKAGKYTLKIDLVKNGITYTQEQDFTWGVLAINVNKSIYLPNEDSFIGIGVLDDNGKVVCSADVTLEITNPSSQKTTLTTANNDIKISDECQVLGVTLLPDYYTTYSVDGVGTYVMNLTAATSNGVRSIQDNFTVQNSVSFDVARKSATRIYPLVPYKMEFTINANDDYSGPIVEYVPSSFAITPQSNIIVNTFEDEKQIIWITDLARDNSYKLSYEFDAPDISPEFYLLGPLEIGSFKEARQWQIASDAPVTEMNFSYPDAGAPGMNLVVSFVGTGFASNDNVVINSTGNITVGPVVVTDANGNRVDSSGRVLTTVFYIHPNATAQDVRVNISGTALATHFKIINPSGTNDGNFSGFTTGVHTIGNGINGTRTKRGTIVLDSLIIPAGVNVIVNTTDLDPNLKGDQGFLPVTIVVDGPVNISGILNVSGKSSPTFTCVGTAGDCGLPGGDGGPGGGGGGSGGGDDGRSGHGGNGFTGGGGGGAENSATGTEGIGGNGTGTFGAVNYTNKGGEGGNVTFPLVTGGTGGGSGTGNGDGGGGGTGFFFGTSGAGGSGAGGAGIGGSGGGGGGGGDGGGGGFAGNGTAGGANTGGRPNGNSQLVPLGGGSGGGGGGATTTAGGGGGGGGGAILIIAKENITISGAILARGGNGVAGQGDGGSGSGGGIMLQSFGNISIGGSLNISGGPLTAGGGGKGGVGRIRVDGFEHPLTAGKFDDGTSNFTGPSIKNITDTTIGGTANASDNIIVYVQNSSGAGNPRRANKTIIGNVGSDGKFDIAVTWYEGRNYIAVIQNSTVNTYTVMSSAAVATYDFVVVPDTTNPWMNTSINNSAPQQGFVVNITANVTDEIGLSFCMFIDNQSLPNGAKNFFNKTVTGTKDQCSQNYTIALAAGNVINFTVVVNDTNNNKNISVNTSGSGTFVIGKIIEVQAAPQDTTLPRLNASLDDPTPFFNSRVNMTANVTDENGLSWCQFIDNMSATGAKNFFNISVAGTNDQCSQNYTISLGAGSVINFTVIVNDTSTAVAGGNKNQSEYSGVIGQIITVNSTAITACDSLDAPNTVYNLTQNAASPGTCIYVLAHNVTLDCKGFDINYSQVDVGYGVNISSFNYTTIRSCNIVQNVTNRGGAANSYGIYIFNNASFNAVYNNSITTNSTNGFGIYLLNDVDNNNITNNTITTSGSTGYGVYLSSGSNNSVYSNTITTSGSSGRGVYLVTSSNNSVYSNTITTRGGSGYGVYLSSSSNNNNVYRNTITTSGSSGYSAYLDTSSNNNNVYSNTITTNGSTGYGVYLFSSSYNNNVYSNNITTSGSDGYGVYLFSSSYNNSVYSNTITTSGSFGYGAFLQTSSDNNSVYSNTITTSGDSGYGAYLQSSSNNNNVYSNNITTRNITSYGVYLTQNVGKNIIYDNNITTNNVTSSYGIYLLDKVANNTFYRNRITSLAIGILMNGTRTAAPIMFPSVYNNTFTNDTIVPCSIGCASNYNDIVLTANATDITFTNVSFNKSRIAFVPRDLDFPVEKNNLTVKWYLDVNVTNSTNNIGIANAQVNINDSFATNIGNFTADAGGGIATVIVTEFTMNGSVPFSTNVDADSCIAFKGNVNITCFTPYNISVNITGYNPGNASVDVNRSKFVNISLVIIPPPDISNPRMNASLDDSTPFFNSRVNMTANVTDENGLSWCQFIDNMSATGAKNYFNISVAGTNDQCSQNYTISLDAGSVINFTVIVNDTSTAVAGGNKNQSEYSGVIGQIITVNSTAITACDSLDAPNTVYNLTQDAASAGTCMYVLANNVTLDCKGFDINYSQSVAGYGINNSGFNYSTIRSCNIVQNVTNLGGAANSYGIYIFKNASFNAVYNTSITTNSTDGYGIYLLNDAKNSNITNNTITTSGGAGYSAYLSSSSNNNSVYSNTITTSGGASGYGVYLFSSSKDNNVYSNTITTSGSGGYGAILESSSNNNVYSNTITTSGGISGYGVYLFSSSNNSVYSNTITTGGSFGYGAILQSSSNNNNVYSNNITTRNIASYGVYLNRNVGKNTIYDNNITTNNMTSSYGIYLLDKVANNTFYRNRVASLAIGILMNGTRTAAPIMFPSVYNNTFTNDTIITCTTGCAANYNDIVLTANATDITFTNVSFNKSRVAFVPRDLSVPVEKNNLTVKWYLDVNVTNSTNNIGIANAQVNINDSFATNIGNFTADAGGGIATVIVTEFTMNGSVPFNVNLDTCADVRNNVNITCFTPYNISVNISGYNDKAVSVDVNRSKLVNISLVIIPPPPDNTPPVVNTSFNVTNAVFNDVINFSGNITDETGLLSANWTFNVSGSLTKLNYSFPGGTTSATLSNSTALTCVETCVVNFTLYATDTNNNVKQNSTLITVPDITPPVVNTSFNATNANDVINFSGNVTDGIGLLSANWTFNVSGSLTKLNYTFAAGTTSATLSNSTALDCVETCVINFTLYATDTSNNVKQNSTLIVVADRTPPVVNTSFNVTSAAFNDVINFSGNITDGIGLLSANWTFNVSGSLTKLNYSFAAGTTSATLSNSTALDCVETCVINFTLYATDVNNNVKQNSTLITVPDVTPPVVNTSFNVTSPNANDIINFTGNVTDLGGLLSANWTFNISGSLTKLNYSFAAGTTSATLSNSTALDCVETCVVNFTLYATDTNNNVKQNSTLIVVAGALPRINASLDDSTPFFNSRVNLTANVSDNYALSFCQFIDNMSATGAKNFFNVTVAGTSDQCSQNYTISLDAGSVINFTVIVNDTTNNKNQSEYSGVIGQIITVNSTAITACDSLDAPNTVYNLTQDAASGGTCMYVLANNVTLDCKGFDINYSQSVVGYGVNNTGYNYSTIKSCNIVQNVTNKAGKSNSYGIYIFRNASFNVVYNNSITTNSTNGYGIYLFRDAKNNNITNNTITTSGSFGYGVYWDTNSNNNNVYSNTITTSGSSNALGVYLLTSSNNSVYSNTITTSESNGNGVRSFSSSNNSVYSNTITTSGSAGYGVYLSSGSNNSNVYSNTITTSGGDGYGVRLDSSSNNNVYSNTITTSGSIGLGAALESSSNNNSVYSNTITTSGGDGYGVWLSRSSNNSVYSNTITTSGTIGYGAYLDTSSNSNNFYSNNITTSNTSSYGIYLNNNVYNNTIYGNNITTKNMTNSYGIYLLDKVSNNTFYRNTISSLAIGILFNGTDINADRISKIYSNTFTNDTIIPCSVGCAANYNDIILTANATDITFTNVSFNKSRVAFVPRDLAAPVEINNLTVRWYLDVNVTNSTNNIGIANAQVNINDSFATNIGNFTADATGGIATVIVTEFTMNGSVPFNVNLDTCTDVRNNVNITCFTPYNISVNISGYNPGNKSVDVNRSKIVNLSLTIIPAAGDITPPIVNTSFNISNPLVNDVINFSGNITDETGLLSANWTFNVSGSLTKLNYSFPGGTTSATLSNSTALDCVETCVVNFTLYATDTNNNVKQNSTLITVPDITPPVVNTSFNATNANDVINFSGNVTDLGGLLSANWTFNISGSLTKLNYTLSGTSATLSNSTALDCVETCVINFTLYATDTNNNVKQNSTLIVVADRTPPVVNTSFNVTSPVINDVINFSGNITDGIGLLSANWTFNVSGSLTKLNYTFAGGTTKATLSNSTALDCVETCVINFTLYATDTNNNVKQNSTLIVVAGALPRMNASLDDSTPFFNSRVNLTANVSDNFNLSFCQFIDNMSATGAKNFFNKTVTGTKDQCSQNYTISLDAGNVINFTVIVNDTSGNKNQSEYNGVIGQIITVNSTAITACDSLDAPNTVYNLTQNVASAGTCMYVLANNVTLDCKGFDINYSQSVAGYGVNISSFNYTTIRSCNIVQNVTNRGGAANSYGIYIFKNASFNAVYNNSITTNSTNGYGIYLLNDAKNNNITNNTITTRGGNGHGARLDTSANNNNVYSNTITTSGGIGARLDTSANNNNVYSNTITTSGINGYGMYLFSSSNNNSIYSNTITTSGSSGYGTVLDTSANNNNVYSNTITTSGSSGYGVYLSVSSNNSIYSNNITTSGSSGRGVNLESNSNNSVYSNTITTSGSTAYGVYLVTSSNNNVYSNNITTSGSSGIGSYLFTNANNNNVYSNTITTRNITSYGVYLTQDVGKNIIYDNNITTNNMTSSYGIYLLDKVANNTFYRNRVTSLAVGILMNGTRIAAPTMFPSVYNNTFTNDTIVSCSVGCAANYQDIVLTANATDITFLNVSFNKSRIAFVPRDLAAPVEINNLTVKWYLDVNVTNSTNSIGIANAQVNINDSFASSIGNFTADAGGGIATVIVTEFTMNGSVPFNVNLDTCTDVRNNVNITCFTPYNISVNISGYNAASRSVDVNRSKLVNISLVMPDTTFPVVNTSFNVTDANALVNSVVNFSGNITDETGLLSANWTYNLSGSLTKLNYSFAAGTTSTTLSNSTALDCVETCVVNFTLYATDTNNNVKQNSTLIVVADRTPPVVNTSFNISSPSVNDVINFTGNVTDSGGLLSANWTYNLSGSLTKLNYSLSGTSAQVSNTTTLACVETCVINFTLYITDINNNVKQNSTLIVVADRTPPVVNTSFNKSLTNIFQSDVINITAKVTDASELSFCQFIENQSLPNGAKQFINKTAAGTSDQCSQNYTIALATGNVINFTVVVNDTLNNLRTNDTVITVVPANTAPVITLNNVSRLFVDPIAGGSSVVLILFNVTDNQGVGDINASKAIVNLTLGARDTAQFRFNISDQGGEFGTCYNHTISTTVVINCTVMMRYYDNASSNWVINISVQDLPGATGRNDTNTFTYNSLAAFSLTAKGVSEGANINFSILNLGENNQRAKAPILLNNTGNSDFGQINITAAALVGVATPSETIEASSFFVNITNNTAGNGLALSNFPQAIPGIDGTANATLLHGPGMSGDNVPYLGTSGFLARGNLSLLFWVDVPSSGLSAQSYSSTWNLTAVDLS